LNIKRDADQKGLADLHSVVQLHVSYHTRVKREVAKVTVFRSVTASNLVDM